MIHRRFLFWIVGLVFLTAIFTGLSYATYESKKVKDYNTSENRSGVQDTPRDYFIPPTPAYEKLDPQEWDDYDSKDYSPYARLQIDRMLKVGSISLSPGYYLVKLRPMHPSCCGAQRKRLFGLLPDILPSPHPAGNYFLLIKRISEVLVTVPVTKVLPPLATLRKKDAPIAKLNQAEWDPINGQSVSLQYCATFGCYQSGPLQPGWAP